MLMLSQLGPAEAVVCRRLLLPVCGWGNRVVVETSREATIQRCCCPVQLHKYVPLVPCRESKNLLSEDGHAELARTFMDVHSHGTPAFNVVFRVQRGSTSTSTMMHM